MVTVAVSGEAIDGAAFTVSADEDEGYASPAPWDWSPIRTETVKLPALPLTVQVVDVDVQPLTTVSPVVVHEYESVPVPPVTVTE